MAWITGRGQNNEKIKIWRNVPIYVPHTWRLLIFRIVKFKRKKNCSVSKTWTIWWRKRSSRPPACSQLYAPTAAKVKTSSTDGGWRANFTHQQQRYIENSVARVGTWRANCSWTFVPPVTIKLESLYRQWQGKLKLHVPIAAEVGTRWPNGSQNGNLMHQWSSVVVARSNDTRVRQ